MKNLWQENKKKRAGLTPLFIEDEKGMSTPFYPDLALNAHDRFSFPLYKEGRLGEWEQNRASSLSLAEHFDRIERDRQIYGRDSAISPFCSDNGIRTEEGAFYWGSLIEKKKKMASAKTLLRDFSLHYESVFRNQVYKSGIGLSETQAFFNSNLLYLIAATDGNEDNVGHSQLVARYTLMLTKALGIEDEDYLLNIERGALLHDIGKIGIPESILRKAGPLTVTEREIIKEHPQLGYEMIEEFQFLRKAERVVLFHHERYDGQGYPYGLAGDEIPLEARIFAIADTLDAMTSDRPYRQGQSFQMAFDEIERSRGSQFDPSVVDAFFSVPHEKWQQIKVTTEDSLRRYTIH